MARDDFARQIKETLAKRVGFRCSNPDCQKLTSGPQREPSKSINIGVASHIFAASQNGPRYNRHQTSEARCSIENGIWLCQNCAKLVDNDELRYTADLLFGWKKEAEEKALKAIEGNSPKHSDSSDASNQPQLILYKVSSGNNLVRLLEGMYAIQYKYDEFLTEEDGFEIGYFLDKLTGILDALGDMNPLDQIQTGIDLDKDIAELDQKGYYIFGGVSDASLSKNTFGLPSAMIEVLRKDNPKLASSQE